MESPPPPRNAGGAQGWAARVGGEGGGGPSSPGAWGPAGSAVPFDDPLDASQAYAGAGEFASRVQPLERLEQLVRIGRLEAGPVVAHVAADPGFVSSRGGELDGGIVAPGGEFPGVS